MSAALLVLVLVIVLVIEDHTNALVSPKALPLQERIKPFARTSEASFVDYEYDYEHDYEHEHEQEGAGIYSSISPWGYEPRTRSSTQCSATCRKTSDTRGSSVWPMRSMKKTYSHAFFRDGRDSMRVRLTFAS